MAAPILGFCRHMLGSREEAEDAVQHTFAAAYNDLQRGGERQIALKPWLYTIARNRCLSLLRARREATAELEEIPTDGLHEQVERRAELRELLGDLRELPEEQRAALLLAEAADLSHAEVAGVLGCEVGRVKALVFRARSGLIERREARETPCADIREQLANLRGGSLRRSELRHHLRHCPGCSDYREQVRRQRQMFAVALPVVPSMGLKSSVLSAAGIGGGAAGGGAAAAAGGGAAGVAAAGGGGMALGGSLGSAAVAKVALVAVLAGGGVVAGEAAVERVNGSDAAAPAAAAPQRSDREAPGGERGRDPRLGSRHAHERRAQPRAPGGRAERSALERPLARPERGRRPRARRRRATAAAGSARSSGPRSGRRASRAHAVRQTHLGRGQAKPPAQQKAPAAKPAPQPQAQAAPSPSRAGRARRRRRRRPHRRASSSCRSSARAG